MSLGHILRRFSGPQIRCTAFSHHLVLQCSLIKQGRVLVQIADETNLPRLQWLLAKVPVQLAWQIGLECGREPCGINVRCKVIGLLQWTQVYLSVFREPRMNQRGPRLWRSD